MASLESPRRNGPLCTACGGAVAVTDALTGLVDRAGLHDALEWQVAARAGIVLADDQAADFAILLIDLDRFKAINDTMGYASGDALLVAVAKRLRRAVRGADVLARLGGDEFAILLAPPASPETVSAVAGRIVDLLSRPFLLDGRMASVGGSVGITLSAPESDVPGVLLLRQASLAIQHAKQAGRGRFVFFDRAMQDAADERRQLETDLRAALHLGQFEMFYQPQVQLAGDRLTGFEALIRWRHPVRGMVAPDRFIAIAEELRLIGAIGDWVLMTACMEAAGWPNTYSVAVNVSAQQFESNTLVESVGRALSASGLAGRRLELEVTETALLRDDLSTMVQLAAVKAMGVQVSLDDFGTGYSSLTQLRAFSFDRVKIDRSFVDDEAVVRAISALCNNLGMLTTVEGIETTQQMNRLRGDGCTDIQGYLLSRPVPANQVIGLIETLDRAVRVPTTLCPAC